MILYLHFNKTALYEAVKRNNVEIAKLLINHEKIDINIYNIWANQFYKIQLILLNEITIQHFNVIQNLIVKWYMKIIFFQ